MVDLSFPAKMDPEKRRGYIVTLRQIIDCHKEADRGGLPIWNNKGTHTSRSIRFTF